MRQADLDRGDFGNAAGKKAEMLDLNDVIGREESRGGLRDLDRMVEGNPRLSRYRKDQSRVLPRDGTAAPRPRSLPADNAPRKLTVYRQRILNKQKTAVKSRTIPVRAQRAFSELLGDRERLRDINNHLSENVGDLDALDDATKLQVQRMDRVIRTAEAENTADNIVYTPVHLPASVNRGNVKGWLENNFYVDTEVNFDRYTVTSHDMARAGERQSEWRPLLEIATRRGAYVGMAPHSNSTNPKPLARSSARSAAALRRSENCRDETCRRDLGVPVGAADGGLLMPYTKDDLPEPGDPDFFAKWVLPDDVEEDAFSAGAPMPRVVHRPPRPRGDDVSSQPATYPPTAEPAQPDDDAGADGAR